MVFRGIQRFAIGIMSMFAVMVLGLVMDSAGGELIDLAYDYDVHQGPWEPVLSLTENLVWVIVPFLLLGITIWMLWSPVREERREEQMRRLP
ncbi:hypothetical protein [Natrinema ejinorense]|uniref:Uncharacterized protein n=1 Tax=Natrinema ejinorense TaxID=373386 RepID=A0A2A5QRK1_9EURY|nr:hypothetical protein [Natrinema ejinorense]PCR89435.1 hypothetical protein CP557_02115 [Natrinema ejinorense]